MTNRTNGFKFMLYKLTLNSIDLCYKFKNQSRKIDREGTVENCQRTVNVNTNRYLIITLYLTNRNY